MARIIVEADDHTVVHWERVTPADFDTEHFCRYLAERLGWAVADAEDRPLEEPPVLQRDCARAWAQSVGATSAL